MKKQRRRIIYDDQEQRDIISNDFRGRSWTALSHASGWRLWGQLGSGKHAVEERADWSVTRVCYDRLIAPRNLNIRRAAGKHYQGECAPPDGTIAV